MSKNHVSVYWDGEWDEEVMELFDSCFDEPKGEVNDG